MIKIYLYARDQWLVGEVKVSHSLEGWAGIYHLILLG